MNLVGLTHVVEGFLTVAPQRVPATCDVIEPFTADRSIGREQLEPPANYRRRITDDLRAPVLGGQVHRIDVDLKYGRCRPQARPAECGRLLKAAAERDDQVTLLQQISRRRRRVQPRQPAELTMVLVK